MILGYTDLTSPLSLSWNENDRTGEPRKSLKQFEDHEIICCIHCNDFGEVCTCPIRHAAYTTNRCSCWRFPLSIFLVSRKVNRLADKIFFYKNHFILWDSAESKVGDQAALRSSDGYLADQNALLLSLPKHSLSHLRWIRLNFHSFYSSDGLHGTPCHNVWIKLITVLKTVTPVAQLTVDLDFVYEAACVMRYPEMSDDVTEEKWTTYQNIIELFKVSTAAPLFRGFFIRFGSPMPCEAEGDLLRWQRERILEARVMGDDYDAAARGMYRMRARGFPGPVVDGQKPIYEPDGKLFNDGRASAGSV